MFILIPGFQGIQTGFYVSGALQECVADSIHLVVDRKQRVGKKPRTKCNL